MEEARLSSTKTYDTRGLASTITDSSTGSTKNYCYDGAGNLSKISGTGSSCTSPQTSYVYDAWDRMTQAVVASGARAGTYNYTWDGLSRMNTAGASGAVATYTYQGSSTDRVRSAVGATTTNYAFGPYGPLAQKVGSASPSYFLKDLHGDVVGLAQAGSSTVTGPINFDPWGNPVGTAGTSFGFQGDPTDQGTGLVQTATRLYDPTMGRFNTQDSVFGSASNPGSLNQYAYVSNSPISNSDPTGMGCLDDSGHVVGCTQVVNGLGTNGGHDPDTSSCVTDVSCGGTVTPIRPGTINEWDPRLPDGFTHCTGLLDCLDLILDPGRQGNLAQSEAAYEYAKATGFACENHESYTICYAPPGGQGLNGPSEALTIGHVILADGELNLDTLKHELGHVRQSDALGLGYVPAWGVSSLLSILISSKHDYGSCNPMEIGAGPGGGYPPCVPAHPVIILPPNPAGILGGLI